MGIHIYRRCLTESTSAAARFCMGPKCGELYRGPNENDASQPRRLILWLANGVQPTANTHHGSLPTAARFSSVMAQQIRARKTPTYNQLRACETCHWVEAGLLDGPLHTSCSATKQHKTRKDSNSPSNLEQPLQPLFFVLNSCDTVATDCSRFLMPMAGSVQVVEQSRRYVYMDTPTSS